jgi:hypothetical protein
VKGLNHHHHHHHHHHHQQQQQQQQQGGSEERYIAKVGTSAGAAAAAGDNGNDGDEDAMVAKSFGLAVATGVETAVACLLGIQQQQQPLHPPHSPSSSSAPFASSSGGGGYNTNSGGSGYSGGGAPEVVGDDGDVCRMARVFDRRVADIVALKFGLSEAATTDSTTSANNNQVSASTAAAEGMLLLEQRLCEELAKVKGRLDAWEGSLVTLVSHQSQKTEKGQQANSQAALLNGADGPERQGEGGAVAAALALEVNSLNSELAMEKAARLQVEQRLVKLEAALDLNGEEWGATLEVAAAAAASSAGIGAGAFGAAAAAGGAGGGSASFGSARRGGERGEGNGGGAVNRQLGGLFPARPTAGGGALGAAGVGSSSGGDGSVGESSNQKPPAVPPPLTHSPLKTRENTSTSPMGPFSSSSSSSSSSASSSVRRQLSSLFPKRPSA